MSLNKVIRQRNSSKLSSILWYPISAVHKCPSRMTELFFCRHQLFLSPFYENEMNRGLDEVCLLRRIGFEFISVYLHLLISLLYDPVFYTHCVDFSWSRRSSTKSRNSCVIHGSIVLPIVLPLLILSSCLYISFERIRDIIIIRYCMIDAFCWLGLFSCKFICNLCAKFVSFGKFICIPPVFTGVLCQQYRYYEFFVFSVNTL